MGIVYPEGLDSASAAPFGAPSNPEITPLSSAGSGNTRNLDESIVDLGLAVMALEGNAAPLAHDHSGTDGDGIWPTSQLAQANTHQNADTDENGSAIHHTLGTDQYQAAPGNHVHDYQSSTIINKPFFNCTSTTRPTSPALGTTIYEEDTKRQRVWDAFPGNTQQTGFYFSDSFQRVEVGTIGPGYAETYYPNHLNGTAGISDGQTLKWYDSGFGHAYQCQYIAQRIDPSTRYTETPDQVISLTTGNQTIGASVAFITGAGADDAYFRMSDDGQTYVRMSVRYNSVIVRYTTSGPANEQLLGQVQMSNQTANEVFVGVFRGNTLMIYQNGILVGTVTDKQGVTNQTNLGWGLGLQAGFGILNTFDQTDPSNLANVTVQDALSYVTTTQWSLLASASKPIVQLRSGASQRVRQTGTILSWQTVLADTFGFFTPGASLTDIVVSEAGWYDVSASVAWGWELLADHALTAITINGLDTVYKTWQWVQGSLPGFSQTVTMGTVPIRLAVGDILRVEAAHNAIQDQFTYWNNAPNQDCTFSLTFLGP